ncbi:MAG: LysM peptidoglycan-binding domain-containing protein [Pirellulales bacterium]|nr:LysM peptidoglycan-binding domain-containing protein [Pirellulales bacterium]
MNSAKTLLICLVLAAVAYGVYVSISRRPETAGLTDIAPPWSQDSQGQPLGADSATPQFPGAGPNGAVADPAASGFGAAPSYPGVSAAGPTGGTPPMGPPAGGTAPAFVPPSGPPAPVGAMDPATAGPYPSGSIAGPASGPPPSAFDQLNSLRAPAGGPVGAEVPGSNPLAGRSLETTPTDAFSAYMQDVQAKLDQNQLADALRALTFLYGNPDMPPDRARQVVELLDQLAGTVVYSRDHWLEAACVVGPGDTSVSIAQQYGVPWRLLARINGLGDADEPQPGQTLKVVRGPFHALIDLNRYELTLMLDDLYAGRFQIGVGQDYAPLEGSYVVTNMTRDPEYYAPNGPEALHVRAEDPANPLGNFWIGLAKQAGQNSPIGIHGTNNPSNVGHTGGHGTICLGDRDIEDVFGILSIGSRVTISARR